MNQPQNPHEFPVPKQHLGQFQSGQSADVDAVEATSHQDISPIDEVRLAVAEAAEGASTSSPLAEQVSYRANSADVDPNNPESVSGRIFSVGEELERQRNRVLGV